MMTWILWAYIVLLLGGGFMGYYLGKSKVSLVMALVFAVPLALCASSAMPQAWSIWFLAMLAAVFTMRLIKTRKFMPSGMMLALTLTALACSFL